MLPVEDDPTCQLTTGEIVYGNPSLALRSRRKISEELVNKRAESVMSKFCHIPEHTYDTHLEDDETFRQISEELKEWKEGHKKTLEAIESSKAPQILKIDFDAMSDCDGDLSEEEDEEEEEEEAGARGGMTMASNNLSSSSTNRLFTRQIPPSSYADDLSRNQSTKNALLRSIEIKKEPFLNSYLKHDESIDVDDEAVPYDRRSDGYHRDGYRRDGRTSPRGILYGAAGGVLAPVPPILSRPAEPLRPISGPASTAKRKFRRDAPIDKSQPKMIDPLNPIIRSSINSPPDGRFLEMPRAGTSQAALSHPMPTTPPVLASQLIRGRLSGMPLLPSKCNK